eukprot:TRINITY_DN774134_c0_g1_i1.p1 TRINITY_DN774134_c0_g1~~TRINITY_DN774134_c0_g1_i1.p1  ORF type:complete len:256 (+),score=78.99 TRINITY_DN774134_c0_g1_i1:45-812(+)
MAYSYDRRTTTFSTEGKLYQVEYACKSIENAPACVGILLKDAIILGVEKPTMSKLLKVPKSSDKIHMIDDHIYCAVAGLTSDANILINRARLRAQQHKFTFDEPQPVEQLAKEICDHKQAYTQFGGLRPFGVSLIFAGWDENRGFQLLKSDPSGVYLGWKATAAGKETQSAKTLLKKHYKEDMSVEEGLELVCKSLMKAMDTTMSTIDKMDIGVLTREDEEVSFNMISKPQIEEILAKIEEEEKAEKDRKAAASR